MPYACCWLLFGSVFGSVATVAVVAVGAFLVAVAFVVAAGVAITINVVAIVGCRSQKMVGEKGKGIRLGQLEQCKGPTIARKEATLMMTRAVTAAAAAAARPG